LQGERGENLPEFVEAAEVEMAVLLSFVLLGSQIKALILKDRIRGTNLFSEERTKERKRNENQRRRIGCEGKTEGEDASLCTWGM
jgi:hypothetical protein